MFQWNIPDQLWLRLKYFNRRLVYKIITHKLCLKLFISVDLACLADTYPSVSVTDLQLTPQGTSATALPDTCTACSTGCGASNFYADDTLAAPVTSTTATLYFNAGTCGADYVENTNTFEFTTSIGTAYVTNALGMVFEAQMPSTDFTCTYSKDISGVPIGPINAAMNNVDVSIFDNPTPAPTALTTVNYEIRADRVGTDVVLGSEVEIELLDLDDFDLLDDNFYFQRCIASNFATDPADGSFKSFTMVDGGCATTDAADPTISAINPQLSRDGQTLTYDQFGFIDIVNDPNGNSLTFHLSCDIRVGTYDPEICDALNGLAGAMASLGRKRRSPRETGSEPEEYHIELDFSLTDSGRHSVHTSNGMVFGHDEQTIKKHNGWEPTESSSFHLITASLLFSFGSLCL